MNRDTSNLSLARLHRERLSTNSSVATVSAICGRQELATLQNIVLQRFTQLYQAVPKS
jgi:hypothetical protein